MQAHAGRAITEATDNSVQGGSFFFDKYTNKNTNSNTRTNKCDPPFKAQTRKREQEVVEKLSNTQIPNSKKNPLNEENLIL